MALFLGLDIGTTSTIGILIDDAGKTLVVVSRPVTLYSQFANWAEEDTDEWWRNAGEIVRELIDRTSVDAGKISGVGVTGMLPAVILVDESGIPLRRSIQQNDARAVDELDVLRRSMDENDFVRLTGTGYSQQLIGPKITWLRKREPETFQKARYVMGASDYIISRLTSTFQVEHNWALESGLVNLFTGQYEDRLLESAQIDPWLLPPIRKSHEIVGTITPAAAAHLGIS